MSTIKKLASQTAVYGLSNVVGRLLNYLLTPILTNYFLPAEYGINTEVYSYITFLNVLFTYGMETAYFKFNKSEPENTKVFSTISISIIISSFLFCGLLLLAAPAINAKLHYQARPEIMWIVCGIMFFDTLSIIPFNKLRLDNKPLRFALLKLLGIGINICLTLFVIYIYAIHQPITMSAIFMVNLIASTAVLICFIPEYIKMSWQFDMPLFKKILPYALPLLIVGLGGMINETFDRILLNFYLPDDIDKKAQIGIYGACYKISLIITMFVQAFRMAGEPFFFNQADKENAKDVYARIMQVFTGVCLLIILGTLLFINQVQYFIGSNYRVGLSVVPILLFANLFLGIYYNLSVWYKLTNKTIYGTYITLIGALVTLVVNILLIPTMGYVGSAWATVVCYFIMMLASYYWGQQQYRINYSLLKIAQQILIVISIYAIHIVAVQSIYFQFGYFSSHSIAGISIQFILFFVAGVFIWKTNKHALKD